MNKLNNTTHQDHKNNNVKTIDSRSLHIRTIEGLLQEKCRHKHQDVFVDYYEYSSLTITHEIVIRNFFSRNVSEDSMFYKVADLRKFIMDRLVEQFPCLHSRFEEGFEYNSFENPIRAPFDILNINEINLDGESVIHSFIVLDHVFAAMHPTAETELYRILQKACAKLLKDDEFIDECSVFIVSNPAAALKPCFRRYEDKVFRMCGF